MAIRRVNVTEAQGPQLARARAAELYAGQDFWLQVDGHSRCEQASRNMHPVVWMQKYAV